jgi:hypothetical protein
MTKLAHHFTLLYYKMLIKGNYCTIMQLKLIIPAVHFGAIHPVTNGVVAEN